VANLPGPFVCAEQVGRSPRRPNGVKFEKVPKEGFQS